MSDRQELDKARQLLGLDKVFTLKELKQAYRDRARELHPDSSDEKNPGEFHETTEAYTLLLDFISSYPVSLERKNGAPSTADEEYREHLMKFYDGWLGNLDL